MKRMTIHHLGVSVVRAKRISAIATTLILAVAAHVPAAPPQQKEISPLAGYAEAQRVLTERAPAELTAFQEAEAALESAWIALRDARPEEFEIAAATGFLEGMPVHERAGPTDEYERWVKVLEAANPEAYALNRFGRDVGRFFAEILTGRDQDEAAEVLEELTDVLLLLISAYAADRVEAAGPKAEAALETVFLYEAPDEWAVLGGARVTHAAAEAALWDAAEAGDFQATVARYVGATARIRHIRTRQALHYGRTP